MFRASAASKYRSCPGSLALDEANPENKQPLEVNEITAEGTFLHSCMDPANASKWTRDHITSPVDERKQITPDQLEVLETALELEETFIVSTLERHGITRPPDIDEREQEYRMRSGITTMFTGHPDRVMIWKEERLVLIPDYKFGWIDVPNAVTNLQLQAYVCMVAEEHEANKYVAAIIQPRSREENRVHSVAYELSDIWPARQELIAIMETAKLPGARRIPGPAACRYCIGLHQRLCLEARLTPSIFADLIEHHPMPSMDDMTPEQRCSVLDLGEVASHVIDSYITSAKKLLEVDATAIKNWRMQPTGSLPAIDDVKAAYRRLTNAGYLDADQFIGACKVSVSKLGEAVSAKTGITKKAGRELVDDRLNDLITKTPKAPALRRD